MTNASGALASAARAAGLAPSVHNTQPWRWRVFADRLDLHADRSRQLGIADPYGRLLMISCGAALHHARVALAAEGWQASVTPQPDPADPDLVARLAPAAHVGATAAAMRLFQAAERRRSDRRPVTGAPVPREALAAIRAAVEAERLHLHLLQSEQVSDLTVAASRADELESADESLREELAYWVGGDRPAGTGVPDTALPAAPTTADVPQRDFGRLGTLPTEAGADRAASYAVIFGEEDGPGAWLRAGEALSAAWLTAVDLGVGLLPFSAPVEVAATRAILRRVLAGLGHPHLVVRLGVPDPEHPGPPATPRLDAAQTVEIAETG